MTAIPPVGTLAQRRLNKQSRTYIVVERTGPGHEVEQAPGWMTLCEEHGTFVLHDERKTASRFAAAPDVWCEACRGWSHPTGPYHGPVYGHDPEEVAARFWPKVRPNPLTGCWMWLRAGDSHGYGAFTIGDQPRKAHRVAWLLLRGPHADELELDHLCWNRRCVNPEHLEPVVHLTNVLRGEMANRTHCPQGHEYTPVNTRFGTNGQGRKCRTCHREREHERYRRVTA